MATINITYPTCWQELTQAQLRYVFYLLSTEKYTPAQIQTLTLFRWAGIEVISPEGDGFLIRYEGQPVRLTALQIAEILPQISWLTQLPLVPVRLERIGGHRPVVNPDLSGLSYESFIICDNYYQGYLHTQNRDHLGSIAAILYGAQSIRLQPEEYISIFYWFASAKASLARRFHHFFVPAAVNNLTSNLRERLQTNFDNQLRALTGGDITKEDAILHMDLFRALTELDAQAREFEELKKQTH